MTGLAATATETNRISGKWVRLFRLGERLSVLTREFSAGREDGRPSCSVLLIIPWERLCAIKGSPDISQIPSYALEWLWARLHSDDVKPTLLKLGAVVDDYIPKADFFKRLSTYPAGDDGSGSVAAMQDDHFKLDVADPLAYFLLRQRLAVFTNEIGLEAPSVFPDVVSDATLDPIQVIASLRVWTGEMGMHGTGHKATLGVVGGPSRG